MAHKVGVLRSIGEFCEAQSLPSYRTEDTVGGAVSEVVSVSGFLCPLTCCCRLTFPSRRPKDQWIIFFCGEQTGVGIAFRAAPAPRLDSQT